MTRGQQTMQWLARPCAFLEECAARHGDVFTLHVNQWAPAVFFSRPDDLRDIFAGDPDVFLAGRGQAYLQAVLGSNSLLTLDGPKHRQQRRLLSPPLHGQRMKAYARQIVEHARHAVDGWAPGRPFSMQEAMLDVSRDIILHTVFGLTPDHARLRRFRGLVTEYLRSLDTNVAAATAPGATPRTQAQERCGRVKAALHRMLLDEIMRRRAQPDPAREDVLELLLSTRDEAGVPMSPPEIRDELLTLLLAGHETTATTLAWVTHLLDENPETKARLRAELRALGPTPEPDAIAQLPWLAAVCNEAMRIRPVLPAVTRWLAAPARVGGFDLDAGTYVVACIHLAHRRPETYPEPERFRPERFIERAFTGNEFLPFGGGARRCVGAAFAVYEMKLVLATILSRYDVVSACRERVRPVRRSVVIAPSEAGRVRALAWND